MQKITAGEILHFYGKFLQMSLNLASCSENKKGGVLSRLPRCQEEEPAANTSEENIQRKFSTIQKLRRC